MVGFGGEEFGFYQLAEGSWEVERHSSRKIELQTSDWEAIEISVMY